MCVPNFMAIHPIVVEILEYLDQKGGTADRLCSQRDSVGVGLTFWKGKIVV